MTNMSSTSTSVPQDSSVHATQDDVSPLTAQYQILQGVHEERLLTYALMEQGYQEYIKTGPNYEFTTYRQLIHEVSEIFNECNQRVKAVKTTLQTELHREDVCSIIDDINKLEKQKLELASQYYQAGQRFMDEQDVDETEISELTKQLDDIIKEITSLDEDLKHEMRE